ncbi:MAG: TonB-dependent receptor family protein [Flavisolibacter sp.]
MKRFLLSIILSIYIFTLSAQIRPASDKIDSSGNLILREVIVKAYEQNRSLSEVNGSVSLLSQFQLNRFSNLSILPALNTIPGVRMEERSPSSYRLNIRGSSLRSPFGVRNVKIYFNEIPLTDPGGNTNLNELGYYNIKSIEIIKGTAGSLYGAGIGGSLLINSMPANWRPGVSINYITGSFATNSLNGNIQWGTDKNKNTISYTHQTSNGYRTQTQMRRDIVSWETMLKANDKQTIHAYMLYSDLYYQTPGGLNQREYDTDPTSARPPVGSLPGAVQSHASIYLKTFLTGISNEYHFNNCWKNTTAVYGAFTDVKSPGIRIYGTKKEPHFGGRSNFEFKKLLQTTELQLNFGAEAQKGFFNASDYKNKQGARDSLQTNDNINNWQYMIFGQIDLKFPKGWIITAGASFNKSSVEFTRLSTTPEVVQKRDFENKIAPRISLLKKITVNTSVYASAARGFSPPTTSELLKSSGVIGSSLQPEDGIDYEIGIRGDLLNNRLHFDINAFFSQLKNTIVQRIDTNNVYYYVNAGSTKQNGIETFLSYQIANRPSGVINNAQIWSSITFHDFHYNNFKQLSADYSGNMLPGVPPKVIVGGLDIATSLGIYTNITYTYTDRISLNDASTAFANSYNLLAGRIGYRKIFKNRLKIDFFGGIDNIFNTKYSLGDDINASAGRYFNAAPGTTYFVGLALNNIFH